MDGLPLVFTRAEARAAGLTDKVLRGPRVQRVLHGTYVRAGVVVDTRVRSLAALRSPRRGRWLPGPRRRCCSAVWFLRTRASTCASPTGSYGYPVWLRGCVRGGFGTRSWVVSHVEHADDGRWLRRFDLSFPEHRLAIEYDGRQHAESSKQWQLRFTG